MSIGLTAEASKLSGLSLVVGLAVMKFFNLPDLMVKWPNDLMLHDMKVGGILIESRSSGPLAHVSIGIGLNLLPMQNASYQGLSKNADPLELAIEIHRQIEIFFSMGFSHFQEVFEKHMWRRGRIAEHRSATDERKQILIRGVTNTGALITEDGSTLDYGEIFFEDRLS